MMKTMMLVFVTASLCAGQVIHQPAAPLPDQLPLGVAFDGLPLDNRLPHAPKDSLVGPPKSLYDPLSSLYNRVSETSKSIIETEAAWTSVAQYSLTTIACLSVVACGLLPAILLPQQFGDNFATKHLSSLLSFSVGSLLGDVFLHILPEAYANVSAECTSCHIGLATISGLLLCFLVEKCCAKTEESQHKAAAILNLVANLVDNFTHGLAVTSSFFVGIKFGLLTTLSILLHEIPHEISDFAILLRAGFNRWSAVRAQCATSIGGIAGAALALTANLCSTNSHSMTLILAFTAGGFINIALVQVLPELQNKDMSIKDTLRHICLVLLGIATMGAVNMLHAH